MCKITETNQLAKEDAIIAYKGFHEDMTCLNFKYEVGKSYHEDEISIFEKGFHCCAGIFDILMQSTYFNTINSNDRLCKVKIWGNVQHKGTLFCASDIEILEDIIDQIPQILEETLENTGELPSMAYIGFNIPIELIIRYKDAVLWNYVSHGQTLPEDFIREFQDKVDWENISHYQKLSEEFIREFQDKVNWYWISICQKLSEDFIREFKDKINWGSISTYQKLSESFIREFKDKVRWSSISYHQRLSESFIREFQDKVDWYWILFHQNVSKDFILEFQDRVDYIPTYFDQKENNNE